MLKLRAFYAAVFVSFCLICPLSVFSIDTTSVDWLIEFSKKLNTKDISMFDYSELMLTNAIAKAKGTDADKLRIQLAATYIMAGKVEEGEKILKMIPSSNKEVYAEGQAVLGEAALKKGKIDLGVKALENYFKVYSKTPPATKSGEKTFRESVMLLKWAYENTNQPSKAAAVVGKLGMLEKSEGPKTGQGRDNKYFQLVAKLDGAEKMRHKESIDPAFAKEMQAMRKKNPKDPKDWRNIVQTTFKEFDDLRWFDQDATTAFSYVQKGRGYYLLGQYEDAQKEINISPELIAAITDAYKREGALGQSPGAMARFWLGKVYQGMAEKEKDDAEKKKLYIQAVKRLFAVMKKFPDYPRANDAYAALNECCDVLKKKYNTNIKLPKFESKVKATAKLVPPEVNQKFKDKKFNEIIKPLSTIVKAKRSSFGVHDALQKLLVAYAGTGSNLEGLAICDYLKTYHPSAEGTAYSMLVAGEMLWKRGEKEKPEAIDYYEMFIDTAPDNQYAGPIAFRIAKDFYDKAAALASEVNKMGNGEEKLKKRQDAVREFKKAIPYFQRIIKTFAQSEYGSVAFYLLALSYASSEQFGEAAQTYLNYIAREEEAEKPDWVKIIDSKLRVATMYYLGGKNLEKRADEMREQAFQFKKGEEATAKSEKKEEAAEEKDPKMVQADQMDKEAKDFFKKSIEQLKELLGEWFKPGSRFSKFANDKKVKKVLEDGYELMGWAYDAEGEKAMACKAFTAFIQKYPQSKRAPGCMMRMGVIYTEMNEDTKAERVLGQLMAKYPQSSEAKNASFFLGRSLFNNKKFEKSIIEFQKIFAKKQNLTVANLRWIAGNLTNCGGEHPKNAAELALKACEMLLKEIKKPNLEDWVGKDQARVLKADPAKEKKTMAILSQKILFDFGTAAFWSGDYKAGVEKLTELLENEKTPYFYDAKFLRADIYAKMKQFGKARTDLGEISMTAMTAKKDAFYTKSQCMIGDIYIDEAATDSTKWNKAFATFDIIASLAGADVNGKEAGLEVAGDQEMTEDKKKEKEAEKEWIEYAIYKAALCLDKMDKTQEKNAMIAKYKKLYPKGRFLKDIRKL